MARDRAADLPSTRWVIAHFELIVGRRAESKHTFIRVSRTTWAVIGAALLIPWAVVLWIAQAPSNPTAKATAANAVPKVRPKPDVSRLPAGQAAINRGNHTLAKVKRKRLGHACRPPAPARSLNLTRDLLGIPNDSFSWKNALELWNWKRRY